MGIIKRLLQDQVILNLWVIYSWEFLFSIQTSWPMGSKRVEGKAVDGWRGLLYLEQKRTRAAKS